MIRERIKEFASTKFLFQSGKKFIILDEADQMTSEAQAALRRTMESFSESALFCIICNYRNNITQAIQSRCTKFRFAPISPIILTKKLYQIADLENIKYDENGIKAIVNVCAGDMRRCLMLMQSISTSHDSITESSFLKVTGLPSPIAFQTIIHILFNDDFDEAFTKIRRIQMKNGISLREVIRATFEYTLRLKIPSELLGFMIDELSHIEESLIVDISEKIQLSHLIGVFHLAREAIGQSISINEILNEDIALSWERDLAESDTVY